MKRFVLITAVGAAALLGGPGFLAVNLFPGHLGSFGMLAQGCVALALGTAVFASGMLGLAESYEKTVSRLSHFLDDREHAAELAVRDEGDWRLRTRLSGMAIRKRQRGPFSSSPAF